MISGFRSLLKAFRASYTPAAYTYDTGENADLICDNAGVLWTRSSNAPIHTDGGVALSYTWNREIITDSFQTSINTVFQMTCTANDLSGSWEQNRLYVMFSAGPLTDIAFPPLFTAPIPDGPGWLNVTFTPPWYDVSLVNGLWVTLSSTPLVYTATPVAREAHISIAGGVATPPTFSKSVDIFTGL
jgi:hypothetical protein